LREVLPFLRERRILPSGDPPQPRKLLVTDIALSRVKRMPAAQAPEG
jgi:hypothetical protein